MSSIESSSKKFNLIVFMPAGGEAGVIQIWPDTKGVFWWAEFRGPPYSKWGDDPDYGHYPMQIVHDTMEGWHTTVLHQGSKLLLTPKHPDYQKVLDLLAEE